MSGALFTVLIACAWGSVPLARGPRPAGSSPATPPAAPQADAPAQLTDVGPIEPEHWRVIAPRQGDTFALKTSAARPVEIVDTVVQASPRTALICYEGKGPYRGFTIRNSILKVEPGTIPLDRSYWGFRGYDMIDVDIERVEITGFGKITPKHDEGHAIYLNLAGSLTIRDSSIHHNGGQAIQLVNRPAESVLDPGPADGTITIQHTSLRENGFNPDRGGFQLSIFGTGQPVRISDVEILAGLDGTVYPTGTTGGGILIEPEAFGRNRPVWWHPEQPKPGWHVPFTQGATELSHVVVRQRRPDKPLAQIKGCESLYVHDCWFEGGRIELDNPRKPGRRCGRITWTGNGGDADVFLNGKRIGKASDDFAWPRR